MEAATAALHSRQGDTGQEGMGRTSAQQSDQILPHLCPVQDVAICSGGQPTHPVTGLSNIWDLWTGFPNIVSGRICGSSACNCFSTFHTHHTISYIIIYISVLKIASLKVH